MITEAVTYILAWLLIGTMVLCGIVLYVVIPITILKGQPDEADDKGDPETDPKAE